MKISVFFGAVITSLVGLATLTVLLSGCKIKKEEYIKVGLLHSLTGTMALSETPVRDSELLAIKEINEAGGVLGKKIKAVQEDGQSDPATFAEKARKLLSQDEVVTIFGCWTSASRKSVKPVVEELFGLLWYPIQYEGMEASPNIMYMGASPNQQVVPAIDYCAKTYGKKMYLLGSDYIFPRTANRIIKAQLGQLEGECVGETYVPMGHQDFKDIIEEIKRESPDVIINTLNGDSNIYFFHQFSEAGLNSNNLPVMSFSIAEEEVNKIGIEHLKGHLVAWNYYETTETPRNAKFVSDYKNEYGSDRVTGDPIEAGYIAVYMWAAACEKAGSFDVEAVRMAVKGLSFTAPEGTVTIDGANQHLYKQVRIGKINSNGLIDEIWTTPGAIKPDPYLSTYEWARGL
ncbi:MAG: urea ABC transporter substrate-binding protein [Treponema sp.]|nr:urea ABC transporter substrate-binding protein [Treponema sp.]